jgi:hypothetical protein
MYAQVREVGKKVRTTLTIDGDVLKTAMEIGINVSQFCENALKEAIEKLKSPKTEPNGGSTSFSLSSGSLLSRRESEVLRPGSEHAFTSKNILALCLARVRIARSILPNDGSSKPAKLGINTRARSSLLRLSGSRLLLFLLHSRLV